MNLLLQMSNHLAQKQYLFRGIISVKISVNLNIWTRIGINDINLFNRKK